MSGSILLPITGSQASFYAMDLAWTLAENTRAQVNAQHVIDIRGALEFIGLENPGLIGSGPYLAAYEKICAAMRDVSTKLQEAYAARLNGQTRGGKMFVDEGDPAEEICSRSLKHDLVIMGHRRRERTVFADGQTVKLSLAEKLVQYARIPVLIVQKPVTEFGELAMFCAMDHVNTRWIGNCLQLARLIGATPSLTFLAGGQHEARAACFVEDLKAAHPELSDIYINFVSRADGKPVCLQPNHLQGLSGSKNVLAVVPTIDAGERRITSWDECPNALVRRLQPDAVLFWPEESIKPLLAADKKAVEVV